MNAIAVGCMKMATEFTLKADSGRKSPSGTWGGRGGGGGGGQDPHEQHARLMLNQLSHIPAPFASSK